MVFFSTDRSSCCIFTPARAEKKNHSPDHLDAQNPLPSGSLLQFMLPVQIPLQTVDSYAVSLHAGTQEGSRPLRHEKKKSMDVAEEHLHALGLFMCLATLSPHCQHCFPLLHPTE